MKRSDGFTIVELLVIILVIGILVGVTVVSYDAITNRAYNTGVSKDLKQINELIEADRTEFFRYPTVTDLQNARTPIVRNNYDPTRNNLLYCVSNSGNDYALLAKSKSGDVFISSSRKDEQVEKYEGTFSNDANTTCSAADVLGTADHTSTWFYTDSAWQSWIE